MLKVIKNILSNKKRLFLIIFVLCLVFLPMAAKAGGLASLLLGWSEATLFTIFATILFFPIYVFGTLVSSILIPMLVSVANYNNFLSQEGVTIGWTVVRDLANLFVVAGILLVAIGTLFNIEAYSYKKLLPKLILGAIIINFSKMIVGFMIDISQVITLTFVNGFEDIAAGNLINAIGIGKILSIGLENISSVASDNIGLALLGSLLLGVIVLVVTAAVLVVLIAYFVGRIIILWIAIVLSPLLFVMPFIPGGDKFASQMWGMVSKQLFSGPLVAFFLWLSFTIMAVLDNKTNSIFQGGAVVEEGAKFGAFISQFGTFDNILNFIVVIGLLFTSLMMASQMGAVGGKLAGNLAGKLQEAGKKIAFAPGKLAWSGTKWLGREADKGQRYLQRKFLQNTRVGNFLTGKTKEKKLEEENKRRFEREQIREGKFAGFTLKESIGRVESELLENAELRAKKQADITRVKQEINDLESQRGSMHAFEYQRVMQQKENDLRDHEEELANIDQSGAELKGDARTLGAMKSQIDQETQYDPNRFQWAFSRIAASGLSMNIPKVKEGIKMMKERRHDDEMTGLAGLNHDVASAIWYVPWKKSERKTKEFFEQKASVLEKMEKDKKETDEETDLMTAKLANYYRTGEGDGIVSSMMTLTKDVDFNELFKGPAINKMMPIIRDSLLNRKIKDANGNLRNLNTNEVDQLMDDIRSKGGVNEGYTNHFLDYMLERATDGNEDIANRYRRQIEQLSIMSGSPWLYGNSYYDTQKNKFVSRPVILGQSEDGHLTLRADEDTLLAQAAKTKNLPAGQNASKKAPNAIWRENEEGEMGEMHGSGYAFMLQNLNGAILNQLSERGRESRADFIIKSINNTTGKDSLKKLEKKLEEFANASREEADRMTIGSGYNLRKLVGSQENARKQLEYIRKFMPAIESVHNKKPREENK
ncbi:hypothetical protein GYA13_03610 [Candidatus Kuenenbacteria bacterium]|nr:hypothetical protein [Candidatus Kuenenbacteria bacterium]